MTNMLTQTEVSEMISEMMPVMQADAGAGAGCRTTWQKVRTGAVLALAGALLLALFGSADVWAQGMTLDICPTDYGSFPENAPALTCGCSAAAAKTGTVWGTNPYYYQSGLCRAALHAGAIGADGGQIVVQPEKSTIFPAVLRNGVEARSSGPGMGFRVVVARELGSADVACACRCCQPGGTASNDGHDARYLPDRLRQLPEDAPPLTCGCSAATVKTGTVWGANPYYYQSGLCRAALHAGAIGAEGGQIVVQPKKSAFYPAVSRNGVEARSSGGGAGFSISATAGSGRPGSPLFDAASSAGLTLDICPIDYGSFPADAPPLTCGCSAATVKSGTVWGANPYYYQSGLCRAALHAGAIGAAGGKIEVKPEKAAFFPAVSRNGVEARSSGEGTGFRVTPVPGSAASCSRSATLGRSGGQADPGSDRRDPSRDGTCAALHQLRHRPGQAAAIERTRPAGASCYASRRQGASCDSHWPYRQPGKCSLQSRPLAAPRRRGLSLAHPARVDSGRLRSDGRGLMEPIADNTSESGRALNRRVEVKASN